ncbi:ABC transporter permease subunit [Clostridium sp. P21]|uniref:ABC transporter permease subunit n=1 Tax=Clostridium muellerianum TaxID=2716538 RepID=A0A7Y0HNA8_9CLOT|nr:ABC transporter permease [Clostridium muellerianum]NMM62970.1 ABC transporter permease subunit [Clostridium muellerianum]
MYNLLKFEMYKLKYNKTFISSVIVTAFSIIWCIYLSLYNNHTIKEINDYFQGREFGILINNFQDRVHPKFIEYFYSAFGFCPVISILVIFLVGSIVIDEYTEGTIKNIAAYGHKRVKIYISKLIIICLSIFILIILLLFGTAIMGSFISGWNGTFSFNLFIQMMKVTISITLVYFSLASIYICLAVIIRNKSIFAVLSIIGMIIEVSYLFQFNDFFKHMPMFMFIEICMLQINLYSIILNCSILIIITTLVGAFIFKNLELK